MREEESKKVKNGGRKLCRIRKMVVWMLKNEKRRKGSVKVKRLKGGWDEE